MLAGGVPATRTFTSGPTTCCPPLSTTAADTLSVAPPYGGAWMRSVYGASGSRPAGTPLIRNSTYATPRSSVATASRSNAVPAVTVDGAASRTDGAPSLTTTSAVA
ncbi:hypothetical protein COSO111634_23385 [Corallococcus soli]